MAFEATNGKASPNDAEQRYAVSILVENPEAGLEAWTKFLCPESKSINLIGYFSPGYRCAIVVKPKRPVLEWLRTIDSSFDLSLDDLQRDSHLYLIPDYESAADIEKAIEKYVKNNYSEIFLSELSGSCLDAPLFPKMTFLTFQDWFDVSTHTMIFDTVSGSLEKE